MGDIVKPVATWISNNVPWAVLIGLFIISLFFEISKVKIYPLKWLWKAIAFPFKKVDERRTESFRALVVDLKGDYNKKIDKLSSDMSKEIEKMNQSTTSALTNMINSTNNNCSVLKRSFSELEGRLDTIDTKQGETEERLDKLAAARIKNHVLNFARQCRKGEPHSHEDFANLFKENEEYEALVEKYKGNPRWKNDVYVEDYAYIKRAYREVSDKGGFLM